MQHMSEHGYPMRKTISQSETALPGRWLKGISKETRFGKTILKKL